MICKGNYEALTPSVRLSGLATHVEPARPRKGADSIHGAGPACREPSRNCVSEQLPTLDASAAAQDPRLVAVPVALFLGRALVVLFLALGEADLELRAALVPVQVERHQGVALAFD